MKKLIFGFIILFIGFIIICLDIYIDSKYKKEDEMLMKSFTNTFNFDNDNNGTNNKEEDSSNEENFSFYKAVIEIPNISLKTGIILSNSDYSTMNRNVSIYPTSDMPDVIGGNFVIFGHSGNSRVSYFKYIDKLKSNDEIFILYKKVKYKYKVINKFEVKMTDTTILNKIENKTIITLITCSKKNKNLRTIIVGELMND